MAHETGIIKGTDSPGWAGTLRAWVGGGEGLVESGGELSGSARLGQPSENLNPARLGHPWGKSFWKTKISREQKVCPVCTQPHDFLLILIVLDRHIPQISKATFSVASQSSLSPMLFFFFPKQQDLFDFPHPKSCKY